MLALLAALVLASSATADSSTVTESPAASEGQTAPEGSQTAPAGTSGGEEATTPAAEETVAETPVPPVEETVAETPAPPVEETVILPPPVEEVTQVITPVEEIVEQPIKQVGEAVQQAGGGSDGGSGEETSKGAVTPSSPAGVISAVLAPVTEATTQEVAGTTGSNAANGSMPPLAVESSGPSGPGEPPTAAGVRAAAGQHDGLGCPLSALGDAVSQSCAVGWLGGPSLVPTAQVGLGTPTSIVTAVAAANATSGGGGDSGSPAIGNRPIAPAPGGSAPGGAAGGAGGAGAGSAGGLGLSAFLTLAGLFLLATPYAMRRLRLLCLPWRTAFFVLIPERPG
ncbi:MAG TPA: hypothetical protein VGG08_03070 [Solirubrobacteraceae bacterium]